MIEHSSTGRLFFHGRIEGGDYFNTSFTSDQYDDNNWHHVVGVRNGTTWELYVDGILKCDNTYPSLTQGHSPEVNLTIGCGMDWQNIHYGYINGIIDEVCIYNRSLGEGEIKIHYERYAPVHNLDTDEYFTTIQTAIDDSDTLDGHTIYVRNNTYNENVVVDKQVTLMGEDRNSEVLNQ